MDVLDFEVRPEVDAAGGDVPYSTVQGKSANQPMVKRRGKDGHKGVGDWQ